VTTRRSGRVRPCSVARRDRRSKRTERACFGARSQAAAVEMFNFALPCEFAVDFNPVLGTQARKPRSRERFLVDPEIVQLVGALDAESVNGHHLITHWFLLILLTAQRPGEVAAMRWDQLDIFDDGNERPKTGWWNVRTSKNKQPIHAALSPEVVRLLRALLTWSVEEHARIEKNCARRRGPRPLSAYVFPAGDVAEAVEDIPMGHDQFPATERVRDRKGVRDWTPHDLRRTTASSRVLIRVRRAARSSASTRILRRPILAPMLELVRQEMCSFHAGVGVFTDRRSRSRRTTRRFRQWRPRRARTKLPSRFIPPEGAELLLNNVLTSTLD
jgi:integrase